MVTNGVVVVNGISVAVPAAMALQDDWDNFVRANGQSGESGEFFDSIKNLKPQELMDELEKSGKKFDKNKVIAITKDQNGDLVWLEEGNDKAGLNHIIERHSDDFINKDINPDKIPEFLMKAVSEGKIVGVQGNSRKIYEVIFDGKLQRVAIEIGSNGFIVGANPR